MVTVGPPKQPASTCPNSGCAQATLGSPEAAVARPGTFAKRVSDQTIKQHKGSHASLTPTQQANQPSNPFEIYRHT
eukprot:scaffold423436_cov20-Prasinocladus_malaysianus.AAC.1